MKHFQIGWDGKHYTFGMGKFANLNDFVDHFENKPLIGGESGEILSKIFSCCKFIYSLNIIIKSSVGVSKETVVKKYF